MVAGERWPVLRYGRTFRGEQQLEQLLGILLGGAGDPQPSPGPSSSGKPELRIVV